MLYIPDAAQLEALPPSAADCVCINNNDKPIYDVDNILILYYV